MADGGSGDSGNQSDNEETRPRRPNRSKRSDASHLFLKEVKAAFDRATEVFHRITGSSEVPAVLRVSIYSRHLSPLSWSLALQQHLSTMLPAHRVAWRVGHSRVTGRCPINIRLGYRLLPTLMRVPVHQS